MSGAISARTVVAAVTGCPIGHSLSPTLHNAWLSAAGIDAVYVALPCPRDGFTALIGGLRGAVVRGLNVTAPFKDEALILADTASRRARAAGAANLLVFELDGTLSADNTDGEGLLAALSEDAADTQPINGPVVMLGAGGAARSAALALLEAGATAIRIVNRTGERAANLADAIGTRGEIYSVDEAARAFCGAAIVVNTLPAGPAAEIATSGLTAADPSLVVVDMIYQPLVTPLLAQARAMKLRTVDGLSMLIGQARPSFERLFGCPPPALDVRSLAEAAIRDAQTDAGRPR